MLTLWRFRQVGRCDSRRFKPYLEALESRTVPTGGVDVILEWNAVTIEANRVDHTPNLGGQFEQGGPTRTARAFAIVHGAMYDAFNAIDRSAQPYLVEVPREMARGASDDAAVAAAAFGTLSALYPSQTAAFEAAYRKTLARVPNGKAEDRGVALGEFVAAAFLQARANDGSEINDPYVPIGAGPGVFQMFPGEPNTLDPNWGQVLPFGMTSSDQFQAPPLPSMDTQAYVDAYNEVRVLGAVDAETSDRDGNGKPDRTAEQTNIGIYWGYDGTPGLGTPPRLYNQIARTIAHQQHNSEAQNARLFALVNFSMADAGVASWESKYVYGCWRPIRGIQQIGPNGENLDDGNPLTTAEPGWQPYGAPAPFGGTNFTPPFPAYTSGHATFGAALFETLRKFYGRDKIQFTFTSDELNGELRDADGSIRPKAPRTFKSFTQAELENAQSRIYLGIHWGFDRDQGVIQGRKVASFFVDNFMRPLKHHGSSAQENGSPWTAWICASSSTSTASSSSRHWL